MAIHRVGKFSSLAEMGVRGVVPCALLLPLLTSRAGATPTANPLPGITGLGVIPTTQTVAPGTLEASLLFQRARFSGGHATLFPMVSAAYGLRRAELGAAYVRERDSFSDGTDSLSSHYYALHGKYRVYDHNGFAAAIGAHYYDFGSQDGFDLGNTTSLYATGSYTLARAQNGAFVRFHGGVLGQRVKSEGDSTSFARPFIGTEYSLTREVSVGADYLFRHGEAARALSVSARYQPASAPVGVQVGIGKFRSDTQFFVGLTYGFGLRVRVRSLTPANAATTVRASAPAPR